MWLIDIVLNPGGKVPVRNRCKLLSFSSYPNHTHKDKQMKCQGHNCFSIQDRIQYPMMCICLKPTQASSLCEALEEYRMLSFQLCQWNPKCGGGVRVLCLIKPKNGFRHKMVGRKQNLLGGKQSLGRIDGLPAARGQQERGTKSVTA